ncbi:MAG: dimethyl sulfoxide reductase anchor subunit family protein [Bacteroidales bacterium]
MHNNDWSLIFFTLLAQVSVGLMLFLTLMYLLQQQAFYDLPAGFSLKSPFLVALVAIAMATVISFTHVYTPQHSVFALNNLSSSWLSREILGIALFGTGVLLVFFLRWSGNDSGIFLPVILVYTSIAGILLLYFMSRIYMISTIPAWDTWYTVWSFFMAALLTGGFVLILFTSAGFNRFHGYLLIVLAGMLLLQVLAAYLHQRQLIGMEHTGIGKPDFAEGMFHTVYLVRLFILFIAFIFTAYLAIRVHSGIADAGATMRFLSFILALVVFEEVAGRFLFYDSYFRIGV